MLRGLPPQQPSEKFLLAHRLFTFFDEWLFYNVLLLLYFNGVKDNDPFTFWSVVVIGSIFISISYVRMWFMESERFEVDELGSS